MRISHYQYSALAPSTRRAYARACHGWTSWSNSVQVNPWLHQNQSVHSAQLLRYAKHLYERKQHPNGAAIKDRPQTIAVKPSALDPSGYSGLSWPGPLTAQIAAIDTNSVAPDMIRRRSQWSIDAGRSGQDRLREIGADLQGVWRTRREVSRFWICDFRLYEALRWVAWGFFYWWIGLYNWCRFGVRLQLWVQRGRKGLIAIFWEDLTRRSC